MKKFHSVINENHAGMSLEQYLRQILKFTKAQIKSMKFRPAGLMVNGARTRVTYIVRAGDELTIQLEGEKEASMHLVPVDGALDILYEDQDLIAVWKESGLVVHPSHGHYQDTLSNRLHAYFQKKGEHVTIRSIGRLDRDTSGIIVFAKNQVAAARLWKQKEEGVFWKEYLAVCESACVCRGERIAEKTDTYNIEEEVSDQGVWHTIDAPIGKAEGEMMKMCVTENGLRAVTYYQIVRQNAEYTWIRVRIDTGRTHQIRVHMAYIGQPLVGDVIYNSNGEHMLQLCAWKANLLQPFTGETIKIEQAIKTHENLICWS